MFKKLFALLFKKQAPISVPVRRRCTWSIAFAEEHAELMKPQPGYFVDHLTTMPIKTRNTKADAWATVLGSNGYFGTPAGQAIALRALAQAGGI